VAGAVAALLVLVLGGAGVYLARFWEPEPPVLGTLPPLTMVDQEGREFPLERTRGKVMVLGLVYTHCPDICPLITAKMRAVQGEVASAGLDDRVVFLTVTVDPQRDTPAVLRHYATLHRLDLRIWSLLTGPPDTITALTRALGFYVEFVDAQGRPLEEVRGDTAYYVVHSDRFYVVDREGRVRAAPPGSQSNVKEVAGLVKKLARQGGAL